LVVQGNEFSIDFSTSQTSTNIRIEQISAATKVSNDIETTSSTLDEDNGVYRINANTKIVFISDKQTTPPRIDDSNSANDDDREAMAKLGGLSEQRARLASLVTLPLRQRATVSSLGIMVPRGVLLYGAPGSYSYHRLLLLWLLLLLLLQMI
jgi:ATP-dependent 26S proteasome regulatory subunit